MSNHRNTLVAIFTDPIPANIKWRDIEAMLKWYGATIAEGRGSRVRIRLNGVKLVCHRPHPSPDTDKGAVETVRAFLTRAGVET
jgi:HicA toxin of bacterial toxin-antitoxin,